VVREVPAPGTGPRAGDYRLWPFPPLCPHRLASIGIPTPPTTAAWHKRQHAWLVEQPDNSSADEAAIANLMTIAIANAPDARALGDDGDEYTHKSRAVEPYSGRPRAVTRLSVDYGGI
jgi:hypothetical protein